MSFAVQLSERAARHAIFLGVALLAAVAIALNPDFARPDNLANLAVQSAVLALLAIGQTLVITAGLIDLSVGTLMALATVLICDLMQGQSGMTAPAVLLAQDADWVDLDGPLLLARDREHGLRYEGALVSPPAPPLWG